MKNEKRERTSRKSRFVAKRHVDFLMRDVIDFDFATLRDVNDELREKSDARMCFVRERVSRDIRTR